MVTFYESVSPEHHDWILEQPVFFVASAPSTGRHINLSPKGLPSSSFALLTPNEAAYVDATGSGNETISHLRENGRLTVMFCSFDAAPRILRLFCTAEVIEWNEPAFRPALSCMGLAEKCVEGARAVILLHIFKVLLVLFCFAVQFASCFLSLLFEMWLCTQIRFNIKLIQVVPLSSLAYIDYSINLRA